jgi:predicted metal-dependent hydrolase
VNSRDRDEAGRPRNARPRDETGRPLPRDAAGIAEADEEQFSTPDEALAAAQRALDAHRPFAAHEYLEFAWKNGDASERDLWQGLAQLAVALTHLQRGNKNGAIALFERSRERLSSYAGRSPHDIDVDGVRALAAKVTEALQNGEEADAGDVQLRVAQR